MIYGAVDLGGKPAKTDYLGELNKQLEAKVLADHALQKTSANTPDPERVSYANMWDAHAKAFEKAAMDLQSQKDELMKTEEGRAKYQKGIEEIAFGIKEAEAYYTQTHAKLQENLGYARGKKNEQWINMGKHDSHDEQHYVDRMQELDSDMFSVKFDDDGRLIMNNGKDGWMSVNDPRIMKTNIFDEELVLDDVRDPGFYFTSQIKTRGLESAKEAEEAMEAMASVDDRVKIDVARWYIDSTIEDEDQKAIVDGLKEKHGDKAYEMLLNMPGSMDDAIKAWAAEGAKRFRKKKEKSPSGRSQPTAAQIVRTDFKKNVDNIKLSSQGTTDVAVPNGVTVPITNTSFADDFVVTDDEGNVSAVNNASVIGFSINENGQFVMNLEVQGEAGSQPLTPDSRDYLVMDQNLRSELGMSLDDIRKALTDARGEDIVSSYITTDSTEENAEQVESENVRDEYEGIDLDDTPLDIYDEMQRDYPIRR